MVGCLPRRALRWRTFLRCDVLPWMFGCLALGCGGDDCKDCAPAPSSGTGDDPTSASVDATGADSNTSASQALDTSGDFVPECRVDEDCPADRQVCSPMQQCVTCDSDDDCSAERPYCKAAIDEKANRCVACQKGTDCGPEGEWLCLSEQCFATCDPTAKNPCNEGLVCVGDTSQGAAYCAECGPNSECANPELLCVDNACWACNPTTHEGCGETAPYCTLVGVNAHSGDAGSSSGASDGPRCAECRTGSEFDDCVSGACVNGSCQPCNPEDNAGCDGSTPICAPTSAEDGAIVGEQCVQCANHGDCAGHAAGGYCVNNQCTACDVATNEGCEGERAVCVNVAPPSTAPLFECHECLDACDDGQVCLAFTCVDCVTSADCQSPDAAECSPEHTCVPCTGDAACETRPDAPFCDKPSGECVQCRTDADCSNVDGKPACRTDRQLCVECTSDGHCPEEALGCLIIPSVGQYTCSWPVTPGELGPCARCNANECADGLECASLGEDSRCLVPYQDAGECDPREEFSYDWSRLANFCVPDECAL